MTANIQQLKKITILIEAEIAGGAPKECNLSDTPVAFEFIYGVASSGLCPFEVALHEKNEGEHLTLTVLASEAHEFFGHLFLPLSQALGLHIIPETITLNVEVTGVTEADNREVVQSLARALAGGGCGGSCGCGC